MRQRAVNIANFADVPLHRSDSNTYYTYNVRLPESIRTKRTLRDTLTSLTDARQVGFLSGTDRHTMPSSYFYPWGLQLLILPPLTL